MRKVLSRIWDLYVEAGEGEGTGGVIYLALAGVVVLALCVVGIYALIG